MTPDTILFAIRALIQLYKQGDLALIQYATEKPIVLAPVKRIKITGPENLLSSFLVLPQHKHLQDVEPFKSVWDPTALGGGAIDLGKWDNNRSAEERNDIFVLAVNLARGDKKGLNELTGGAAGGAAADADRLIASILIEQWKPNQQPISPIGRMIIAVAQIGFEFLASDPGVLKIGKGGEKVVHGFALAITNQLKEKLDDPTLGTRAELANDLMTALVLAGLETLKTQAGEFISEKHIASLIANAIDPVIKAAEGDGLLQDRMQRILDALAGPAAAAAMKTIADNPGAFFGAKFDSSQAVGALVSALVIEAAKNPDVETAFSRAGLLKLLAAGLKVVAASPNRFIKINNQGEAELVNKLTSSLAEELADAVALLSADKDVDARELAAGIAAAAIEAVAENTKVVIGGTDAWHDLARTISKDVLNAFSTAIRSPDGLSLKKVFSDEKLIDLARIIVGGIATNPDIVGQGNDKIRGVVTILAKAMSGKLADKKKPLTADEWLDLARTMVKELAARPAILAGDDVGVQAVIAALGEVVAGDKNSLLSGGDVIAIAQNMLAQVVAHPALLGDLREDVKNIAVAVVGVMALDTPPKLLLGSADWKRILEVAISEAAANPDRLFGTVNNTAGKKLAAEMIGLVLQTVRNTMNNPAKGLMLNGGVIVEATLIVIRYTSGASSRAEKYKKLLEVAVKEATNIVNVNTGEFGSKEWLRLIRVLIGEILQGKYDALLGAGAEIKFARTVVEANAILVRGA